MRPRPASLKTSIELRVPVFEEGTEIRVQVDELLSYLLLAAFTQGELAADRLALYDELRVHREDWRELEPAPGARARSQAERDEAKRRIRPELAREIDELEEIVERLNEEIARLEADATKVSRAHTFITGK